MPLYSKPRSYYDADVARRAQKMNCPDCGHWDSEVDDSRGNPKAVWRVRECLACGCRFSTNERVESIIRRGTAQPVVNQTRHMLAH